MAGRHCSSCTGPSIELSRALHRKWNRKGTEQERGAEGRGTCEEGYAGQAQASLAPASVCPAVWEATVAGRHRSVILGLGYQGHDHAPIGNIYQARHHWAQSVAEEVSGVAVGCITALPSEALPEAPSGVCEQS